MAKLECKSAQKGIPSEWVTVKRITDAQVTEIRSRLDELLRTEEQASDAVAKAFFQATEMCRAANPSDIWQHVIYRYLLRCGWGDAKWKRVAGYALERAFVEVYSPRLQQYGIRMKIFPKSRADEFLASIGVDVRSTKIDLFLETGRADSWKVFGAAHVKGSIAERIQDDVPASLALMSCRLLSVGLTLDAKSLPPPHGDCVNYGELGGRSFEVDKARIKRDYVEKHGQFDGLFSFNLRTPPSGQQTPSGKRIYTLGLHDKQPDQFVSFLIERVAGHSKLSIG
jgi:hypothetical protein